MNSLHRGLFALAIVVVATSSRAASIRWLSPVSGTFTEAAKWEGGVVPGANDVAIVDATGAAYTINAGTSRTLGGLVVDSADATVFVNGSNANSNVTLTASGGVDVRNGTLLFQSQNQGFSSSLTAQGAGLSVQQNGHVVVGAGSRGPRTFVGTINNNGVFDIQTDTTFSTTSGVYTNTGALRLDDGGGGVAVLTMAGNGQRLVQAGGVFDVTARGAVDVVGAVFEFAGGDVVGTVSVRGAGGVVFGPGAVGTGSFRLGGTTTWTGDLKAGQSLLIQGSNINGNSNVVAAGDIRVDGTLTMRSLDQGFTSNLNLNGRLLTVGSSGRISIEVGSGGDRAIFGSFVNEGVIDVGFAARWPTAGAVYTNRGTINANANNLEVTASHMFLQQAGSFNVVGGVVDFDNGAFVFSGGAVTGRPRIRGGSLAIDDAATGAAAFLVGANGGTQPHLSGNIHAGQDVLVLGANITSNTTVVADADVVVGGLLTLRSDNQAFNSQLNMNGKVLRVTSTGRVAVEAGSGGGDRAIFGNVENDGVVDVGFALRLPTAAGLVVNRGDWNVSANALTLTGGTFRQDGGSFDVVGAGVAFFDSGAFLLNGGTVSGRPFIRGSLLDIDEAATGAAAFAVGALGGTQPHLAGQIHAAQDVLVLGANITSNTTVVADADVVVDGLLTLRSDNQAFNSQLNLNGKTLRVSSSGRVAVEAGSGGGDRAIFGNVDSAGVFDVNFPLRLPTAGALVVNAGDWNVSANAFTLTGGTFRQTGGSFDVIGAGVALFDSGAFLLNGGTVSGRPFLRGSLLDIDEAATGAATFAVGALGGTQPHLAGQIHVGQDVLILGANITNNTTAVADSDLVVDGKLTLRSDNQAFNSQLNLGVNALVVGSSGVVSIEAGSGGGDRAIFGDVQNAGTFNVSTTLRVPTAGQVFQNSGTINVSGTLQLSGGGESFVLDGGAINNSGAFLVDSGAFTMNGGTTTGNRVVLRDTDLVIAAGATAPALFLVGALGGGQPSVNGVIHVGQDVLISGQNLTNNTTATTNGLVVQGVLTLQSENQGFASNLTIAGAGLLIDDTGVLRTNTGSGGTRVITGNIENEGRIETNAATTFTGGTVDNAVTGAIGGTSTATFSGGFTNAGAFAPGPLVGHGITTISRSPVDVTGLVVRLGGTVAGSQHDRLALTGTANVSGPLRVVLDAGYFPTTGDQFTILTAASVSGGFTSTIGLDLGGGAQLIVQQTATSIRLIAAQIPSYRLTTNVPPVAGEPFTLTVEARDELALAESDYLGAALLSASDPRATLPAGPQAFDSENAGVRVFNNVILQTAGVQSLTATDVDNPVRRGSLNVNVAAAALSSTASTLTSSTATLEANGFSTAVLTAVPKDSFGNRVGPGASVTLSTTRGQLVGAVQDIGDGSYRQSLRADTTTGTATVSATVVPSGGGSPVLLATRASISFVPDVTAPSAVSLARGAVSGQNVPLSWTASSSLDTARYRVAVETAAGAALGAIDAGNTTSTTATAADGLGACLDVRFAVTPIDNAGNVGTRSNVVAARTFLNGAPAAPPAPTAVAKDSFVRLTLAPSASCDVTRTRLLRSESAAGPFVDVVADVAAAANGAVVDVVDSLADNDVTYFYVAVAVDGEGLLSAPSSTVSATPRDAGPGAAVAGLVAASAPGGVVELSWLPSADPDVVAYNVYRAAAAFADVGDAAVVATVVDVDHDDVPAADGAFFYAVTAVDLGGNESAASVVVSAVSDRAAPSAAVVVSDAGTLGIGPHGVTVTTSETPAQAPVLRFAAPGRGAVVVALAGSGTVFSGVVDVVEGSVAGNAVFTVDVKDAVGNVGGVASGGVVAIDGVRPTASIVTSPASPVTSGTVQVQLTTSEPVSSTPTLQLRDSGGALREVLLSLTSGDVFNGAVIVDSGVADGAAAFVVGLVDAAGNRGAVVSTGGVLVVDVAAPGAPVGLVAAAAAQGRISLVWQAPAGGAARYRVFRDVGALVDVAGRTPIGETAALGFSDLPPADGTFHYVVVAVDDAGNFGAPSNDASARSDQTPPSAPSALSAAVVGDRVDLAWSAPSGEAAASFEVFRATTSITTLAGLTPLRSGLATTSLVDRPGVEGVFFYAVAARDGAGLLSAPSNVVSVDFDASAPRITVSGVSDQQHSRVPLSPVVTVDDAHLDRSDVTLDGVAFVAGSSVAAEGNHVINASAVDAGARSTTRVVRFTLDFTAPILTIAGVSNGARLTTSPAPTISAADANLLLVSATLNGAPFASGTPITSDGDFVLAATARDRAGNVATQTVSFTVDLPPAPPPVVEARLSDSGITLVWTASPSPDVSSYRVSRDGVVTALVNALTAPGGALPVAPQSARLEVRAVDTFGQLSPPRTLDVDPVRVAVVAIGDGRLTRGTFDQLLLSVQNDDLVDHDVGPAALAVEDDSGAVVWDGDDDDSVTALAARGTVLPLVIFSPADVADAGNRVHVRLGLGGGAATPVTWDQRYDVAARFPAGRLIEPVHGALIRGTEASIGVKVTNRGSATLQVVSARSASQPSDDVVVRLRDPGGGFSIEVPINDPLAGQPIADGRRVVSLAPGTSRTLKPITLLIPGDAPDNCVLEVESRLVHSQLGTDAALSEPGFVLSENAGDGFYDERAVSVVPPPYVATATTNQPEYLPGEVAVISGVATLTEGGGPAAREVVKIVVSSGGFAQQFFARTDDDGFYSFPFFIAAEAAGVFTVSVTHPIVVVKETDATFVVHGLRLDPGAFSLNLSKNASFPVTLTLRNTGETTLTSLAASLPDTAPADGVTAALRAPPPASLLPGQSVALVVDVTAASSAADAAAYVLRVTTAEGLVRTARIDVALFGATPSPLVNPRFLDVSLVAGAQLSRTVTVENKGFGDWQNVRVAPPLDQAALLSLTTAADVGDVVPGATFSFDVLFSPQTGTASGVVTTTVELLSDNLPPIPVNVTATITNDAVGDVEVSVFNLLHALEPDDEDFAIDGANVRLQSQDVFTLIFSAVSGPDGVARFDDVPAGRYTFVVSKSGFSTANSSTNKTATGEVFVDPGRIAFVEVPLVASLVDIEWSVEPVSITDSYDITLSTTFQTNVAVPAVDTVPANQTFDMGPGAVRTGQFELINLGDISAFDVVFGLRQDPNLDVQLAFPRIAEIPARSRAVVPFTVQLKRGATPPCTTYSATVDVNFAFFASGAGVFVPGQAFPASIDVRSHESDVRVEPNTIVRQTFVGCAGFADGEGVLPPAVFLQNAEPFDVEICDCGRITTAGQDLPTLRALVDDAAADVVAADDALADRVADDLAVADVDLAVVPVDAGLDAAGRAFYGDADWDDVLATARTLRDAADAAAAAEDAIDVAQPLLDAGGCESAATGDDISVAVTALGARLSSTTLQATLLTFTGLRLRFDELHLKFDNFCLASGGGAVAEIPVDAGSFAFGTLSFSTATGCGADRETGCCPVSVGFVDHRVVCGAGTTTSTQSGGGGGAGGGWGGWGGGGVSTGSTTGSQEATCTR